MPALPRGPDTTDGGSRSGLSSPAEKDVAKQVTFRFRRAGRYSGSMASIRQKDDGVAIDDRLGCGGFGFENRPVGDVAVPLNQGRNRPDPRNDGLEQLPDLSRNGRVVAVDQQEGALIVRVFGMAGQMDFADS